MKKLIILLLISVCFFNCSDKKETVEFVALSATSFNAKPFEIPSGTIPDSLKHAHDSCMGFSFGANALLLQNRDTFFIGSIVNRKSLKIADTLSNLGLTRIQIMSEFNIISNPCYEKRVLNFPLKSLLGKNFNLRLPGIDEALNKEINNAIAASDNAVMQTGSWIYLDLKDALKNIMDTTKSPKGLRYRKNLLDTSNMVLMAVESITEVSFIISTEKSFSAPLQALLRSKPSLSHPNSQASIRLFYINNNKFEMTLNGFFTVVGEFMKAELK